MRNGKMTYNFKMYKTEGFVRCHIIPFILFWMGVLLPIITNEPLVIICAFVPFYGYLYSLYVSKGKKTQAMNSILFSFFTSVVMIFPFALLRNIFESFEVMACMLVVNSVMSMIIYFLVRISYSCEHSVNFPFYVPPSE